MNAEIQSAPSACMPFVEHPAAPAALISSYRASDEPEREMLVPLWGQSVCGRKTGSQIAHAHDEGNADVNAMLLRQKPDAADLLEIKPARLLDQKRNAAGNQPLGQSRHL